MREIITPEPIVLEEFGIEVTPYLTLEEQQMIVKTMLTTVNHLEQQQLLVAGVIFTCTNLLDSVKEEVEQEKEGKKVERKDDKSPTYEDLIYSGLWGEILNQCPYINDAIFEIEQTVIELQSASVAIVPVLENLAVLMNKGTDILNEVQKQITDKKFGQKLSQLLEKGMKELKKEK